MGNAMYHPTAANVYSNVMGNAMGNAMHHTSYRRYLRAAAGNEGETSNGKHCLWESLEELAGLNQRPASQYGSVTCCDTALGTSASAGFEVLHDSW